MSGSHFVTCIFKSMQKTYNKLMGMLVWEASSNTRLSCFISGMQTFGNSKNMWAWPHGFYYFLFIILLSFYYFLPEFTYVRILLYWKIATYFDYSNVPFSALSTEPWLRTTSHEIDISRFLLNWTLCQGYSVYLCYPS